MNTGNTVLHVPTLHCSWPCEVASSLLRPTSTSYHVSAIFKCKMCQSARRHPVHTSIYNRRSVFAGWRHPLACTYLLTYLLTPWSTVLLEKLTSFRS
jgi:hypothetical protein